MFPLVDTVTDTLSDWGDTVNNTLDEWGDAFADGVDSIAETVSGFVKDAGLCRWIFRISGFSLE